MINKPLKKARAHRYNTSEKGRENQKAAPAEAIVPFEGVNPATLSKTDQAFPEDLDKRVKVFDNLVKSSHKTAFPKNIWEQMDKAVNHKGITYDKEGLEILQPIDKLIRRYLGVKPALLLAANRNVLQGFRLRDWITRYDIAPGRAEIESETNFGPAEIQLIRDWLVSQSLIFLNSQRTFWRALNYFVGTTLIESFSIDAVESAADAVVVYYGSDRTMADKSREAYGSLKIIRAIRQQRDLQLKAKKLELTRSCIPFLNDTRSSLLKIFKDSGPCKNTNKLLTT